MGRGIIVLALQNIQLVWDSTKQSRTITSVPTVALPQAQDLFSGD